MIQKSIKSNDYQIRQMTIIAIIKLKMFDEKGINLEYLYAFTHDKENTAILLLHEDELDRLISALESNDMTIVPADEVYNL